ncbi:hypothetical protein AD006_30060 (plasmid) [Pseudonocardia sp. EC080610-09]|uniref:SDR family oxidoreductase n=1 Tax=unclassified Pseudonocardia TaxID=2619320 RepID=UPI000706B3FE|nr:MULTISPECIES: NAD(P)H-binding protein [unclassified Pseudonocardia]ALL79489.1 hypothetical protein AD006_30060 [Pseudonocardia sp. EC080610-09]ALL85558.1 hypothetical protein AD017_31190 [Pseudonocardia sp. EC080619-01]
MLERVLVTGATGSVGRHVVAQLQTAGVGVRALTRDQRVTTLPDGVEIAEGDLTQPESLNEAFAGIDGMFLFPADRGTGDVLRIARKAGVRRVVVLSSLTVLDRRGGDYVGDYHRRVEVEAERSGLTWTHVRPSEFAGTALRRWGKSIRAEGIARAPYARAVRVPIHEADIAAVAVLSLRSSEHAGCAYSITGPQAMTSRDQVRVLSEALGKEIQFEELDPAQGRAQFGEYVPHDLVESVMRYMENSVDAQMPILTTVERLLGRPPRTFKQWAAEHVEEFVDPEWEQR